MKCDKEPLFQSVTQGYQKIKVFWSWVIPTCISTIHIDCMILVSRYLSNSHAYFLKGNPPCIQVTCPTSPFPSPSPPPPPNQGAQTHTLNWEALVSVSGQSLCFVLTTVDQIWPAVYFICHYLFIYIHKINCSFWVLSNKLHGWNWLPFAFCRCEINCCKVGINIASNTV